MKVGETWLVRGLWEGEPLSVVRLMALHPTGMVDVNYELDPRRPKDLRLLPYTCLVESVYDPVQLVDDPFSAEPKVRL